MIDCGLKEEEGVGLIFVDVKKAFDSIDHFYMFQVLQKFGLGERFISFVKLLFNNISSLCKVNDGLCSPIQVQRVRGVFGKAVHYQVYCLAFLLSHY